MTRVYISPTAAQVTDDNGVGKVVLAQHRYLPEYGVDLVSRPEEAEVIAAHITGDGLPRVDVLHLHGLYWCGDPGSGTYNRWHTEANKRILAAARSARAITVPSTWVAEPFKRDMRLSPTVIGHGIEANHWQPGANAGYVLWNKNRGTDSCDPRPAAALAAAGVQVVATFAPDGITLPTLQVTGTVSHAAMQRLVQAADVYLATTKETFGIGTLEAMAAGVPILGYEWGGTADQVVHGFNGYLVDPGDTEGLLDGLAYIRANRARLSANARTTAEHYTWQRVIEQYAELYRRVAEPEPTGVSVVITNHNYGAYLDACIESVVGQTDRPDIIVVDDGSTDNSRETLAGWERGGHIRVLTQANQGVAAARNAGIAAVQHPFVVCLDADDELAPDYCATLRAALQTDRSLGIAYTGLALLGPDGSLAPNAWPPHFDWEAQATPHNPPSNCIPSAAMFRKAMWERAGGYKQVYAPGEDAEFWTRGLSVGFTARKVSDEGLFHYRVGHQSASRTKEYRPIDTWHPWMRDKQFPMAAPAKVQPLVRSYSDPAVSIVIPVGPGHAQYLPAALDSLLGQTFRNWEVIVVSDTPEYFPEDEPLRSILRPYPFVQFRGTGDSSGRGIAHARNWGLNGVRAPLVVFLDADDYLLPDALDHMLRAYVASDGRYVYSDWIAVNGDKQDARAVPDWTRDGWLHAGLHAVTALIPTAWARDVGGFDAELPGWEDWDFFIKLTIAGYCGVRLPEPLLAYRQHTGTRRQESMDRQAATKAILAARYDMYRTGEKDMGGCCGGNGDALLKIKQSLGEGDMVAMQTQVADLPAGDARMEFTGDQVGGITFFGSNGRQYVGGNNAFDRYANVDHADVERLISTGKWRLIVRAQPAPAPVPMSQIVDILTPTPAAAQAMTDLGIEYRPEVIAGYSTTETGGTWTDPDAAPVLDTEPPAFDDDDPAVLAAVEAANQAAQAHTRKRRGAQA